MANVSSNSTPLVLIADDLPEILGTWESELDGYGIATVKATTLDQLHEVFLEHRNSIAAVILDGCIPGNSPNTIPFIRGARATGFTKPIIAASSLRDYRDMMVWAGCSHQAPKGRAAELAADLLSAP